MFQEAVQSWGRKRDKSRGSPCVGLAPTRLGPPAPPTQPSPPEGWSDTAWTGWGHSRLQEKGCVRG